jgi:dihydroneopterin aldolase/2-amino-4-hydroxy-6-hydroxymethyldihydropteridine diphosphokinase
MNATLTSQDKLTITGLCVHAHHGVFPIENKQGQDFYVNATLYQSTRYAGLDDDLELSTNYGDVCHFITNYLQDNTFQLIEAAAERTTQALLEQFPLVEAVDFELCKPQAPIGLPFQNVSVSIHRRWHKVYVSLGSNLGDREANIRKAVDFLDSRPDVRVTSCSALLETEPYGVTDQPMFLNAVMEMDTLLSAAELLDVLHGMELTALRVRTRHWGPRTLDLDILLYDNDVIRTAELTIPHVDMENRDFVLLPLAEIAPYAWHPVLHKTAKELLDDWEQAHQ